MTRMIFDQANPRFESMGFHGNHTEIVRNAMHEVIYGGGTAGRARLPIQGIEMAGKTGTAQVVSLNVGGGRGGQWRFRDHGLFIFFAPFDNPRYAGAVVIEHGGGSGAAYPIARDVMTYLFDPQKGLDQLRSLEAQWGGTPRERMATKYAGYADEYGVDIPSIPPEPEAIARQVDAEARSVAAAIVNSEQGSQRTRETDEGEVAE
jgi:penicillin-binding protein 2